MTSGVLLGCAAAVLVLPLPAAVSKAPAWRPLLDALRSGSWRAAGAVRAALSPGRTAERQFLAAAEMVGVLVAELRAGRPPGPALAAAAAVPGCAGVGTAARAVALGADIAVAVREVAADPPVRAALERVATAVRVAEASGAPLAEILVGIERDLRGTVSVRRRIGEELAATRATAALLAGLPVLGLLLGTAMGAHPLTVLVHTPVGVACTVLGMAFEAAGIAWVRALIRVAQGRRDS